MDEDNFWVGLDLGLKRSHVCVVDSLGVTVHEQSCDSDVAALTGALSGFCSDRIGLVAVEAGTPVHLVRKLRSAGFPIVMFEARKASRFLAIRRNKTDCGDARGLADLARLGRHSVSQVYMKTPECQLLRSMLVMRKRLVTIRVAIEGVLRSRLAAYGRPFRCVRKAGSLRDHIELQLEQLKGEEGIDLASELEPLMDLSDSLRRYLSALNRDMNNRAKSNPVCRLLMGVPGVGPICALSFYTAIEDPARFRRSADVAAYLGLVPRRYQSGRLSLTFGITKTGSKLTRTHLVTAATVFANTAPDCSLKRWFVALRERAGPNRARVALARKLAVILLTMWKNGTGFEAKTDVPPEEAIGSIG